jgi:hypothetical protein
LGVYYDLFNDYSLIMVIPGGSVATSNKGVIPLNKWTHSWLQTVDESTGVISLYLNGIRSHTIILQM